MSSNALLEPDFATAATDKLEQESIPPLVAQVLDLAKQGGTSLTPRELNAQLAQVLERYDALTASFSENHERLREEMAQLRQAGGSLAGHMQSVRADVLRQGNSLSVLAASTSADVQSVKQDLQSGLSDVQERTTVQLEALGDHFARDVSRLDGGVQSLHHLLASQEAIVQEQALRLDQFDAARELLDTAVRGNRKRIDEVREELESNHTVVTAQVQGLAALHREHRAEFNSLRLMVDGLQAQSDQLNQALHGLGVKVSAHVQATRRTFRWTHAGMAALLLLAVGGFAAVKWLPAFAPASMEQELSHARTEISRLDGQVAAVPSLEYRAATHDSEISQLNRSVVMLKQGLATMQQAVRRLSAEGTGAAVTSGTTPVVNDTTWVMAQAPSGYTVQLAGTATYDEMIRLVTSATTTEPSTAFPYSFTISHPGGQDRYNLFYGTFDSADAARVAMRDLPPVWQSNRPWIRQWQAIQSAAR